jgi:hypothetical protein
MLEFIGGVLVGVILTILTLAGIARGLAAFNKLVHQRAVQYVGSIAGPAAPLSEATRTTHFPEIPAVEVSKEVPREIPREVSRIAPDLPVAHEHEWTDEDQPDFNANVGLLGLLADGDRCCNFRSATNQILVVCKLCGHMPDCEYLDYTG